MLFNGIYEFILVKSPLSIKFLPTKADFSISVEQYVAATQTVKHMLIRTQVQCMT